METCSGARRKRKGYTTPPPCGRLPPFDVAALALILGRRDGRDNYRVRLGETVEKRLLVFAAATHLHPGRWRGGESCLSHCCVLVSSMVRNADSLVAASSIISGHIAAPITFVSPTATLLCDVACSPGEGNASCNECLEMFSCCLSVFWSSS